MTEMRISIVIPTYNRARTIARAVTSVRGQKITDWELIVVDDGSTDDTRTVLSGLLGNDQRVKIITLPKNRGVNFARNRGVEMTTNGWVSFLDSDDEYVPGAFEILSEVISKEGSMADVIGFALMTDAGARSKPYKGYSSYKDVILKRTGPGDTHFCVKKQVFGEGFWFPEWINGMESIFYTDLLKRGKKFFCDDQIVVLVHEDASDRLSQSSARKNPRQFIKGLQYYIREHGEILKKDNVLLSEYYLKLAKYFFSAKDPRGLWWLVKALTINPGFFKIILNSRFKTVMLSLPNHLTR